MSYKPPFTITAKIINLISEISEIVGEIKRLDQDSRHIELRKSNRIKAIHSSLAIENNSLSIDQITAIIEGKRVLGNPNEIREVKNAYAAYNLLMDLNPFDEKDLLRAHALMMSGLVSNNGKYRTETVGVAKGITVIHLAPSADIVPSLMKDLFYWLKESNYHPLVKGCVFHYEFEFIHPFQDGNGRMGRLWQSVILKEWKSVFAWLPIESLIKENQEEYYEALNISERKADSTGFIEFMLNMILTTLQEIRDTESKITLKITQKITLNQKKIIDEIKNNPYITQEELSKNIGIAKVNIVKNMKKLQEAGLVKRVGSDKNGYCKIEESSF